MSNIFRQTNQDMEEQFSNFESTNSWYKPSNIGYVLSRVPAPLTEIELHNLSSIVDVMALSECNGVDIYGQIVSFVVRCMNS